MAYGPIACARSIVTKHWFGSDVSIARPPLQVSLRRLVQQSVVVILRASRPERLSENIVILDFQLTDADLDRIYQIGRPKGRIHVGTFAWD